MYHHCLGLSVLADPNALLPRVTKVHVAGTSAVSIPRTAAAAAAKFSGFLDGAALRANQTDGRCCKCWHGYVEMVKYTKRKTPSKSSLGMNKHASTDVNLGLTFAGLYAL